MIKAETIETTLLSDFNKIPYRTLGAYFIQKGGDNREFLLFDEPIDPDTVAGITFGNRTADADGNTDGLSDAIKLAAAFTDMLQETPSAENKAAIGTILGDLAVVIAGSAEVPVGTFGLRVEAEQNGVFKGSLQSPAHVLFGKPSSIVGEAVRRARAGGLFGDAAVRFEDEHPYAEYSMGKDKLGADSLSSLTNPIELPKNGLHENYQTKSYSSTLPPIRHLPFDDERRY